MKLIYQDVMQAIQQQLNENPNYADLHYQMALFHGYNGNYTAAKKEIEQSLVINPKYSQALELKETIQTLKHQKVTKPSLAKPVPVCFSEMHNLAAVFYAQDGDMDLANQALKEAYTINQDESDYNLHRSLLEEAKGELDSAVHHLQQAIAINPLSWRPYFILSQIYAVLNRMSDASEILAKAVQQFPKYPDLQYHLGLLLMGEGNLEKAIDHLEQAVAINQTYTFAHYHLGNALSQAGNHKRAEDEFSKTIEMGFREASIYLDLAKSQFLNEKMRDAEKTVQIALQLDTAFPEAYLLLGDIYDKLGNVELRDRARQNAISFSGDGT